MGGEGGSMVAEFQRSRKTLGAVFLKGSSKLSRDRDRSLAPGTGSSWNGNGNMEF